MSEGIRTAAISALTPLVGPAMATIFVADAALTVGKTTDELEPSDVSALCDALRLKISPLAARPVVDQVMADITARTAGLGGEQHGDASEQYAHTR